MESLFVEEEKDCEGDDEEEEKWENFKSFPFVDQRRK